MNEVALSVRQPWASLIVAGLKSVEIRSWPTNYRGVLHIHAAKTIDTDGMKRFYLETPLVGVLIGTVKLIKVEEFTDATWESLADAHLDLGPFVPGYYAWHLADPRIFSYSISCQGRTGIFPIELNKLVQQSMSAGELAHMEDKYDEHAYESTYGGG